MQITGTIRHVLPTQKGGYQSKQGYVFTYDMTIEATDGQMYTGEIGSKKDLYPLGNGQQITVDITNTQYGTRFKAISAQHSGQQPTAGQQIMDRMGGKPDYAAQERKKILGMCFTNIVSGSMPRITAVELEKDIEELKAMSRLSAICIDGVSGMTSNANPEWVGENPSAPTDDVAF